MAAIDSQNWRKRTSVFFNLGFVSRDAFTGQDVITVCDIWEEFVFKGSGNLCSRKNE